MDSNPFQELVDCLALKVKTNKERIGLKIVNQDAVDAAKVLRHDLAPLAAMRLMNGEQRACAVFDTFVRIGLEPVASVIGDDIEKIAKEFNVGRGRVDRAIFHKSGRLSLVEIKSNVAPRDVVGGIGQALMYAAQAERFINCSPIIPVLAVLGEYDEDVERACERGGVEYIALGGIGYLKALSEIVAFVLE